MKGLNPELLTQRHLSKNSLSRRWGVSGADVISQVLLNHKEGFGTTLNLAFSYFKNAQSHKNIHTNMMIIVHLTTQQIQMETNQEIL